MCVLMTDQTSKWPMGRELESAPFPTPSVYFGQFNGAPGRALLPTLPVARILRVAPELLVAHGQTTDSTGRAAIAGTLC